MSELESTPSRAARLGAAAGIVAVLLVSLWIRWPGFTQGGFASHDVAGILYNGMELRAGGLPYVDTLELKAPGSFYLSLLFAGPEARDIARFQVAANLWAMLSLVAVAGIGWRRHGPLGAVIAAGLYGLHDAVLDSMDANYVTWANLPQILAVGAALEADGAPKGSRHRNVGWLLAGAFAGLAALMKRPDGIVLPLVLVGALLVESDGRARLRAAGLVLGGCVAAHVPIGLHYVAHGELGALWRGYAFNVWGVRYVSARAEVGAGHILWEGMMATTYFVALPLALALLAIGCARGPSERRTATWLGAWALATLLAAAVGFRFYKGYYLATAAPLCLLAAAPWGLWTARSVVPTWLRSLLMIPVVALGLRQVETIRMTREDRARPHDLGGATIARHVAAHSEPGDTIWVWGWHLWDVYPYAGRLGASPIYKSLGVLTTPNDDTWRERGTPLTFVDGPHAERLVADLARERPAWIVLGSTVPRREFGALRDLLRREYRLDRTIRLGRVQFWERRDLAEARARGASRAPTRGPRPPVAVPK